MTAPTTVPTSAVFKFKSSAAVNMPKTTYIYFVFLCLVPIVAVTWIIIWALCFYGRDRVCCACCRSRKNKSKKLQKDGNSENMSSSVVGENIMMREIPARTQPAVAATQSRTRPPPPARLAKKPLSVVREDSRYSATGSEDGERSPSLRGFV